MKTVTLYEVTACTVQIGDGYTLSHRPADGPRCCLGDGLTLLDVKQRPLGYVWLVSTGEYVALAPELRTVLEAPIMAAAQHEIELGRVELLRELAAGPWWLRVWRALMAGRVYRAAAARAGVPDFNSV